MEIVDCYIGSLLSIELLSVGMVDWCHLSHCTSSYLSSSLFLPFRVGLRSIGGSRWFGFGLSQSCFLFYCLGSSDLVPLVISLMGRV